MSLGARSAYAARRAFSQFSQATANTPFLDTSKFSSKLEGHRALLGVLGAGTALAIAYGALAQPAVTEHAYLDISVGGAPAERVVIGLYGDWMPTTCENFKALATHEHGFGYRGSPIHRVMRGFTVWGGDVTRGDGSGGMAAAGPSFAVEGFAVRHQRGTVSMVLDEEGHVRSQFFITLMAAPGLARKAVGFGKVVEGLDVLDRLSQQPADEQHAPAVPIRITACGVLPKGALARHQLAEQPAASAATR